MIEIKDGAAIRDGERIGTVDGDKLIVPEKLHHQTVKKIEAETGLTVTLANTEGHSETGGVMGNPMSGQDDAVPPVPPAKIEEPEPPKDHRGDKTPAFIDWLFRNRPEEAERRYANRKIAR